MLQKLTSLGSGIAVLFYCCTPGSPETPSTGPDMDAYLSLSMEERRKPENATASFQVAGGLSIALFASEPLVVNPTNMDIDEKGRVWFNF